MRCAWEEYLRLLPPWMRSEVDRIGKAELQELRLRNGQPPKMIGVSNVHLIERAVASDDLTYVINAASQYSPWSVGTMAKGYITANGGHRIGICGDCVVQNGIMTGIRSVTSLCLRVSRDFPGMAATTAKQKGSILIIGPPGSGKTTLLRDLIRQKSNTSHNSIAVVDERAEIFPSINGSYCYDCGANTDIMTGCNKQEGIDMLLRTMGPCCIAIDEITQPKDCMSLLHAGWSGVTLIATAHATNKSDLYAREIYQPLVHNHLFDILITLQLDKSWKLERI